MRVPPFENEEEEEEDDDDEGKLILLGFAVELEQKQTHLPNATFLCVKEREENEMASLQCLKQRERKHISLQGDRQTQSPKTRSYGAR